MAAEIEETNNATSNLAKCNPWPVFDILQRPPSNLDRRISSSYSNLHNLLKAEDMINSNSLKDTFVRHPSSGKTETIYEKIPETPSHISPSSYFVGDDVDFLKAWKQSLRSFIQNDQLVFSLATQVNGDIIKWNSTQIGESGVVKVDDPRNDLSSEVKRLLKILMNWKPDSDIPEAQSSTQVFEKLCGKLACFSPLVRESEATKLVRVWNYFSKQILGDRHDNQFVRNDLPSFTTSKVSSNPSIFSASSNSSVSSRQINFIDEYDYETPIPRNTRAQFHKNIAAAATSATVEFDSSKASSAINDVFSCPNFKAALQTVLLSFPSTTRRILHLICRYIKRIASNQNLKLNESKPNMEYLLNRMGYFIFDYTANYITFKDAVCLIQIMVEKQTTIFSPSSVIIENAEKLYNSRVKGTPAPTITRYCQQIDTKEYQRQAIDTGDELLSLLNSIIADENLSESQKNKKLDSFRKTYPHLYVLRFPEASFVQPKRQPTPTRVMNRIRSLTRRASTKRT
uniref:Uncharacterized protein n=1 Tax=Panagrolaimus superbus TaxID=310955 RepID=A0A914YC61_9BILA